MLALGPRRPLMASIGDDRSPRGFGALSASSRWPAAVAALAALALAFPAAANADGLDHPEGVATDSAGNVFVADTYNDRIQEFDSTGQFIRRWGSRGTGAGQFSYPGGIATNSAGHVFVVDTNNARIQEFDSTGVFIRMWGSLGSGAGQFL